jgi:hypothetical protein
MNTHGLASHDKKKVCTMWFSWEMSRSTPEEPHLNSHFQHCPSSKSKVGMKRSLGAIFQDMNTHSLASHDKKKVCTMWFFWEMSRSTPEEPHLNSHFQRCPSLKSKVGMKESLGAIFQEINTHNLASHDKKKMSTMWFFWEIGRSTPEEPFFNGLPWLKMG